MIRPRRALAPLLLCLTACQAEPPAPTGPPGLLLVSVDTLRADHVGAYGHALPTTPSLDALARRGVRFADTTVPWPKTWPSMASMLTGTYPSTHGVRLTTKHLASGNQTLAEILRRAGFRTGAVVSNVNLGAQFGFSQGFDGFVESWVEALRRETGRSEFVSTPGAVKRYTNARIVTDQGLRWLDTLPAGAPFFLWLHYMDPHGPYRPPPELEALFAGAYPAQPVPWRRIPPYQRQYGSDGLVERDLGRYKARYDGEVRAFDAELARLLDELARRRLDRRTLVVVTADHGESLGEQGYLLEHGKLPWQSTAAVPLVLAWPERLPEGRVVDAPVGLVALLPTLLELLEVPVPPRVQARSLLPLLEGAAPVDDVALEPDTGGPVDDVYMESGYHEATQLTVRRGRWKLVRFRAPEEQALGGPGGLALFDLAADPAESRNLLAERPRVAAALAASLDRFLASQPVPRPTGPAPPVQDATTRAMLEALGYVGEAVGEPAAESAEPAAESAEPAAESAEPTAPPGPRP